MPSMAKVTRKAAVGAQPVPGVKQSVSSRVRGGSTCSQGPVDTLVVISPSYCCSSYRLGNLLAWLYS